MSTPATDPLHKLAFTYKRVQCTHLLLDVYPPVIGTRTKETTEYPMIIYFHGGGLTVGNRESWFPRWLHSAYINDLYCLSVAWHVDALRV